MDAYTSAKEERQHWGGRPPRRPRAAVRRLLILPSCMCLLFVVVLLHRRLNTRPLPPPLLPEHIAQERVQCARGGSGGQTPSARRWCCGHRGARTLAPENTMAAFLAALKVGANCIEMDVHRTSDGALAVIHAGHYRNKILPANGHMDGGAAVRIEDTPWANLSNLDAGVWFSTEFQNERVPPFTCVLETFWDVDVRLIVELKAEKCAPKSQSPKEAGWEELYVRSVEADLAKVLLQQEQHGAPPRFSMLFTSFNHSLVNRLALTLHASSPASKLISGLGYILDPHVNYTGVDFRDTVTWVAPLVSKVADVERMWRGSRCVSSWVTDSRRTMEEQYRSGIQAVTTNLPALCPTVRMEYA